MSRAACDRDGLAERACGILKSGRVLRTDHFHVPAVYIEFVHAVRADAAGLCQCGVDNRSIVAAGYEETILIRCGSAVVRGASLIIHIIRPRNAGERNRLPAADGRTEVHHTGVQGGNDFCRRARLCQIAAAGFQCNAENLLADSVSDRLNIGGGIIFFTHKSMTPF